MLTQSVDDHVKKLERSIKHYEIEAATGVYNLTQRETLIAQANALRNERAQILRSIKPSIALAQMAENNLAAGYDAEGQWHAPGDTPDDPSLSTSLKSCADPRFVRMVRGFALLVLLELALIALALWAFRVI